MTSIIQSLINSYLTPRLVPKDCSKDYVTIFLLTIATRQKTHETNFSVNMTTVSCALSLSSTKET